MRTIESSVASPTSDRVPARGVLWGLIGVITFSLTLPFTHVAVRTLDPVFVGAGRGVVAGALAALLLVITRSPRLTRRHVGSALVVAGGVVVGFPLLTSLAMREVPASHGAVVIGILPAATAVVAVLRGRESPSATFWVASWAGAASVIGFVLIGGGPTGLAGADVLLLLAVVAAAIGYAEGGLLARQIGAWRTICWALVLALPIMVPMTIGSVVAHPVSADLSGWVAFGYVSLFSMFLGFFAWYRGLAIGPISSVSQIQLAQGVFTLIWAAAFFGDALTIATVTGAACVVLCAFLAVTARVQR
ncbi:DMT family transporter [Aeromicrobium sp. CF3.5]|uniref:DMT family transporter n=1 Tax=Aeromicrobium sp. CF3.5 TaxID=3373078 RepID=UPI003EE43C14